MKTNIIRLLIIGILFFSSWQQRGNAQEDVKSLVEKFKSDDRGPYKDIRWFCKDGRINPAKEPCGGENAGIQRARYKDEVDRLAKKEGIYLGQILAGTDEKEFWDASKDHSRLKQYLIERYLFDNDDGWIQRKSQYYRGATQAEDEEEWGKNFFLELFKTNKITEDNFLLIREAFKTIPHGGDNPNLFKIRAISKDISDLDAGFENVRIKIHGNPQASDSLLVKNYISQKSSPAIDQKIMELQALLVDYYSRDFKETLSGKVKKLASFAELKAELKAYAENADHTSYASFITGVELLSKIKSKLLTLQNGKDITNLIDISILIEQEILKSSALHQYQNQHDLIERACYLGQLANATGYINDWEMDELLSSYTSNIIDEMPISRLETLKDDIRRNINWGGSLFSSYFGSDINRFATFEPLANGFYDDRIRSSSLLALGRLESDMSASLNTITQKSQMIMGQKKNGIQGLNPGIAKGKIHIGHEENQEIDKTGIYLFQKPPSDLEPVAGMLAISEGNVVSHLQLLARNLGIPNATIDNDMFKYLSQYEGKEVFYAVSGNGNVVIKLSEEMDVMESGMFKAVQIDDEIINIPIDAIKLDSSAILNIRNLDASATGIYCGPKAANFAQLKKIFPDNLVEGLVIPFGVFKSHMDQVIPGKEYTYWNYLISIFSHIEPDQNIKDALILNQLDTLRTLIKAMPLQVEFQKDIAESFETVLGKRLGNIPVFLRSDTNMEDLKDFTGAGLNLTVFNVQDKEKIYQGIKDVWASPYNERSYKWRQKYLQNPEHVYPSILVIPSVFVDRSGVIITKNIQTGANNQLTVAMSRGVGGAVDGQNSETRILSTDLSAKLLTPSRDRTYNTLTPTDGTIRKPCSLSEKIITQDDVKKIWNMVKTVYEEIPKTGMSYPYDMEFGFVGDHLWIFQIRPFVENKKAGNMEYLQGLNGSQIAEDKTINIYAKI